MKRNFIIPLALTVLIMSAGCKKALNSNSAVNLAKGAKAGFATNTGWQMPTITGRLARYDINDGNNSDCILSYDIEGGTVTLTQFTGTTSTTLYSYYDGFETDNAGIVPVNNWWTDITDNYNEVGGVHIIPYDATGSGHEDHILLYIPLRGLAVLMHYTGTPGTPWHVDWPSGFSGTTVTGSGIGGYDLKGITDKIIAYDYGDGHNNYLMLYRPGYKFVWVLNNNTTPSDPNPSGGITWAPRIQSNGGIGGYDMSNTSDQLAEIGGPRLTYMYLAAYRPGYGNFWALSHVPNYVDWNSAWATNSGGLNGYGVDHQDRIATGASGGLSPASVVPEDDDNVFAYRPGSGIGSAAFYQYSTASNNFISYTFSFNGSNSPQLLTTNPYPTYPPASKNDPGDKVLFFSGYGAPGSSSNYNTSMLFYTPGAGKQSQLYFLDGAGSNYYNEVY